MPTNEFVAVVPVNFIDTQRHFIGYNTVGFRQDDQQSGGMPATFHRDDLR